MNECNCQGNHLPTERNPTTHWDSCPLSGAADAVSTTVYVVIRETEYQGDVVIAVFAQPDDADKFTAAEAKRCPAPFFVRHRVEPFELRRDNRS